MRLAATIVVVGTLYYVPLDRGVDAATVVAIGIGWLRSWRSPCRSTCSLFASTYFVMARAAPTNFTEPLTRTDALYVSITVFTTVGFGDISAKSEAARLIVTLQMLADLLLLGLVIRLFLDAVKRSRQRQVVPSVEGGQRVTRTAKAFALSGKGFNAPGAWHPRDRACAVDRPHRYRLGPSRRSSRFRLLTREDRSCR